ncbi:acyl carrier protein [Streptomyces brasiliscabiei]|uniref:acyl carrier protein n=1 Tax=Streptomyces brasiliscabiei TaxID=2736302 RepID=UPI001C1117A5|nr:acyl carrier protein [Streptomyces brasiliscabiei]
MTATSYAGPARPAGAEVRVPDLAALAAAAPDERARMLDLYVRQELGLLLGIAPHLVDTTGRPMNSLGIGSIAGLELQFRIEGALRVELNLQMLLLAHSAAELIGCLAGQLGGARTLRHEGAAVAA